MGGGGVIRAAAKVGIGGGLGIITNGMRHGGGGGGSASFRPAGASRPVSSVINSSSSQGVAVGEAENPVWDFDDWEFAGGESDVLTLSDSGKASPRMVFGPTPTMKEAEEATMDLKDALDKVYLSSSESSRWAPMLVGRVPGLSILTNSDQSETVITSSAPENALQAFKLLSESTAAQTVVASIACDQNVWNAVLGNPALLEFLDSHKNSSRFEEVEKDSDSQDTPSRFEFIPDFSMSGRSGIGLALTVQSFKAKVLEMISSVTDMLHNIFGPSISDFDDGDDENGRFSTVDKTVGMSLMGLAVMAIMVVLLKRS